MNEPKTPTPTEMRDPAPITVELARDAIAGFSPSNGSASGRDWLEDAPLENGNYQCKCLQCEQTFIGHKRRFVCKLCDAENLLKWNAMTDEEKAAVKHQRQSEFIAWMMGRRQNSYSNDSKP